jgi:hypothetical protein
LADRNSHSYHSSHRTIYAPLMRLWQKAPAKPAGAFCNRTYQFDYLALSGPISRKRNFVFEFGLPFGGSTPLSFWVLVVGQAIIVQREKFRNFGTPCNWLCSSYAARLFSTERFQGPDDTFPPVFRSRPVPWDLFFPALALIGAISAPAPFDRRALSRDH